VKHIGHYAALGAIALAAVLVANSGALSFIPGMPGSTKKLLG
jgi:hypothetical protein